jgi:tRNA-specific 2-thiouridylase
MRLPPFTDLRQPKKIITAMSGGIDSSAAGAILTSAGIKTEGVTLILQPSSPGIDPCGGDSAAESAAETAAHLGIPHSTLDVSQNFSKTVLARCWNDYSTGKTPNPCPLCNRFMKFDTLIEYAETKHADGVATGHYARISKSGPDYFLKRGIDPDKDQSYFLFYLNRKNLSKIFFPLGELRKEEIKEMGRELGIPAARRKESQDACFSIPGMEFGESLRSFFKAEPGKGNFVDPEGNVLGSHQGIHRYTIGQRKGTGISLGVPAYVSRIHYPSGNVEITTRQKELFRDTFTAGDCNWLTDMDHSGKIRCLIQIRYRHKAVPGTIEFDKNQKIVRVNTDTPQRAVTPGQAAVFYNGETVLGGGWIQSYE